VPSLSVSLHLGLPATISSAADLAVIRSLIADTSLPREFVSQLKVHLAVTGFTNILSQSASDVVDTSMVQLLDAELSGLKSSCPDDWTSTTEVDMLVAKLHVYAMVIAKCRPLTTSRDILLKLGFAAALRVVHLAASQLQGPTSDDETQEPEQLTRIQLQRTMPKNYFRGVAFATTYLLRYFTMNSTANAEERQLATSHVMMSRHLFETCSTHAYDEHGRVAALFETLLRAAPGLSDASSKLRHTERMGMSIMLDVLSTADKVRGIPDEIDVDLPTPAVEDASQSRTPNLNGLPNDGVGGHGQPPIFVNGEPSSGLAPPSQPLPVAMLAPLSQSALEPWLSEIDLSLPNHFWSDQNWAWDVFNYGQPQPYP